MSISAISRPLVLFSHVCVWCQKCEIIFDVGFGNGALLTYIKQNDPNISVAGNDILN